jgi:hypothetical protein
MNEPDLSDTYYAFIFVAILILLAGLIATICGGGPLP